MSVIEINLGRLLNRLPPDKQEDVESAIEELMIDWSMNGGPPDDWEDIVFESVSNILSS